MGSFTIIRQMKSRRKRLADHVARMGVKRKVYEILVAKPEARRTPGRPRHRWEDRIGMDLTVIG
jgi:hypothetical protein